MEQQQHGFRGKRVFLIPLMIGALFGITAVVMLLWNAILPALLGVKLIGYWQAMGLLILSRILFGSFGSGSGHKRRPRNGAMLKEKFRQWQEEDQKPKEE
jgi:hypothetical protein